MKELRGAACRKIDGNGNEMVCPRGSRIEMPPQLLKRLNQRHEKSNRQWYNQKRDDNDDNNGQNGKKSTIESFIYELIDCLGHGKKADLSPIIQSELVALIIRSYLADEEIRIASTQPLKLLLHSPFDSWGFAIIPPKKRDIPHLMTVNSLFEWEIVEKFRLHKYIGKIWHAVLIGSKEYETLIISMPISSDRYSTYNESVLYCQANKQLIEMNEIEDEIVYLWKQNNVCFALTRKRSSFHDSQMALYQIWVDLNDGCIKVSKVFTINSNLNGRTDYRVAGAYFHDSKMEAQFFTQMPNDSNSDNDNNKDNNNDNNDSNGSNESDDIDMTNESKNDEIVKNEASTDIAVKHGFPAQTFLLLIGDINMILVNETNEWKCYSLAAHSRLDSFFYHPFSRTFLAVTKTSQLVEIKLNMAEKHLEISKNFAKIQATGMKHYFYDTETDLMIIYRFLGTSTTFKYQLVMIPVGIQLMKQMG